MNGSLRRADESDLNLVESLDRAIFESEAWTLSMWQAELAQLFNHIFLSLSIDNPANPIGFASVSVLDDAVEIRKIGTLAPYRKKGVGLKLLDQIEALRQNQQKNKIILEVSEKNMSAIAFYQKNGFVTLSIRPRYYQDNSAAHCMTRKQ